MTIKHLALALGAADVSIFEIAFRSGVDRCEPESFSMLDGRGPTEALPKDFEALAQRMIELEDRERVLGELLAYVRGEIPEFVVEYRLPAQPGERARWRQARGALVRDDSGVPTHLVGTAHDITSAKDAEEANRLQPPAMPSQNLIQRLETAEEDARRAVDQLRLATDLSGIGVWGYELEGGDLANAKSTFANDGVMASLGYDVADVPANFPSRLGAVVYPEDVPRMVQLTQDCLAGRIPQFDAECRFVHKNGSLQWKLVRGIVTRDATGLPLTFMGTAVDIAHLKQVQEELQRVKDRLELAVLGSRACTWDFELIDGQIAGSTPVFTNAWELCGFDVPDDPTRVGQAFAAVLPPEDVASFVGQIQAFLDGPAREWERELRVVHKDGSDRWHLTRGVAARDARGRATRFTGASIDITDRKLSDRALKESEERFRRTFENAAVGMILTDLEGRLLEYNARFCEFLGCSREELVGRRFVEFMVPDEVATDLENQRRVVRGEIASFTRDKKYFRKDGAIVWGNITVSIIQRDTDGRPVHVMGILQDITERKALEVALRKAQTRLELAMRGSDIAVYAADFPDGSLDNTRWTFFNMWEPLGFDPASMPSRFDQLLPRAVYRDDQPAVIAQFEAAVRSRSPDWYSEHRVLHRDGSLRWRLSRGTLLFDAAGKITSFTGTEADITQLKQIESELSRAREAAEAANRAKDEFLANVSHEIRTPMNAILGMSELALDSAPNDHQRQLLSTVRSAAKNLLAIIDDLLDFSKIEAGKLALDRAPFSLRAAVGDTLRALAVRAHGKGLELLCRVRPDVPDALDGDAGRLRQVLMNLVGNAIKFTPQGEVEVEVEAEPSAGAQAVSLLFSVRDTGIGIALDKQTTIFRAFEQGDASTTRHYGGTGLGLTISAQLAALMGGGISVESAAGRGSTFRFSARFARAPCPEASTAAPELQTARPPLGRYAALRLLVAEDNELNIALLEELSQQRGYHAQFARDGRSALALAREDAGDLLLLDLHMPELDGFEVVRAIRVHERGTGRHLPIIALTARSSALDRERCLAAGVDDFLAKPIEAAVLWAAVDRLLARWPPAGRPSLPGELGLLDPRAILRAFDGQASLFERLRVVFRQSVPVQMSRVRAALSDGDFGRLREAAHQLVGTVGAFSSVTADVASALEDAAVRQEPDRCAALVEEVGALCDALLVATATLSLDALMM